MRKVLLAGVVLAAFPLAASAADQNRWRSPAVCNGNGGSTYCNQPGTQNINQNWNTATGGSATGGAGGAGGSASSNSGASAGSSSGSSAHINNRGVAIAPALPGMASGPCTGAGGGLSVGVIGFSGGVGATSVDPRCTARETARVLSMVGRADLAEQVMLREYRHVMGEDVPTAAQGGAPAPVTAPAPARAPVQAEPLPARSQRASWGIQQSFAYNEGN